jgi:Ca-activated chloride channel family protein
MKDTPAASHIRLSLHPSRPGLRRGEATELNLLVRIHTPELPSTEGASSARPPLNLALVLDRSGSMGGQKMEYARQAAAFAVDQLRAEDRVSVVAFDDRVETVVASTPAADKARIKADIARIDARGSTALHAGWVEGGVQVSAHLAPGHLNRVILFTDGQANVGETRPDAISNDVHGLASRGVSTSTLGIGADYNENLLEAMARSGDGNYYFIESPGQLPSLFAAELRGLLATLGRTVSLGLEPGPGVEILDVYNELPRNSYGRLLLPNLQTGAAPIEVTLRMRVPASFDASRSVCKIRLAWDDPKGGERQKLREKLRLPLLAPAEVDALPEDPDAATAVALLQAAREKRRAVDALERGDREAYRVSSLSARTFAAAAPMAAPAAAEMEDLDKLDAQVAAGTDLSSTTKLAKEQIYRRNRSSGRK